MAAVGATGTSKSAGARVPTHTLHVGLIGLVLSLALFRFVVQDAGDRHRCDALLTRGRWLDATHKSWQPDGCMLHSYTAKDTTTCLEGRTVTFVGDSTVRQVYYAAVKHIDKNIDTNAEKHSDRTILANGVKLTFLWDPFLNGTALASLTDPAKTNSANAPALTVIGGGIWFLRHPDSGGVQAWSRRVDELVSAASSAATNAGDRVVLLPVENAVQSLLSPDRAATVHSDDIDAMNAHLEAQARQVGANGSRLSIATVFNELIAGLDNETSDGLHFSDAISRAQASILLNSRCNDVLPKKFPFDKTCCAQYPAPNWVQGALLILLLVWGPIGLYLHSQPPASVNLSPTILSLIPEQKYLLPMTVFGLSVVLLFLADRTYLFLKENKQYDALTFAVLSLASLGAGLATMKPAEKDLGFLNRDQTDEWKGWMQIAILIYHYLGASKISGIYNPIRVLVAAYLFMSGYGHLSFFLKKADFGFARVANILVRLNLLTVVLAYSPFARFGIIWVTLWIGHQYNERTSFLLAKLVIAAGLVAAYFEIEGPLEKTFDVINAVFATHWNAKEWRFRVTLDMWIVWIGMLTALAFIKSKDMRLTERADWPQLRHWAIMSSAAAMVGFFVFELTRESKFVYNGYHPFVSFVPVLAFVVLRNATPYLRSTSSKFFIFFGQCSLETFIIQFHLFIAGDTRGIIMMIPGGPWLRPLNFAVTSIVFVYISNQVAAATGVLTEWVCNRGAQLPTTATAVGRTAQAAPAAGGTGAQTGDYVAVPTGVDEIEKTEQPVSPRNAHDGVQRALVLIKTDLRCKFTVIIAGLTLLNWIYPS
ncbi:hypothetical protein OIV83_005134 [Microbotryomycetes sp. JL201]|nr:hypothetical protein OIV83_005134 [Microbotryomycetes sp. JL201]